jgi:hypothetical protein
MGGHGSAGWRDDAVSMMQFSWGVKVRRSGSTAWEGWKPVGVRWLGWRGKTERSHAFC